MPPASTSPTDALRTAIRESRSRAALVPGLPSLLDKLDAHLVDSDRRLHALETQVKQLQGMDGAIDEFRKQLAALA